MEQRVNGGRAFDAAKGWWPGDPVSSEIVLKSYARALVEARTRLADPEAYELGDWDWGFGDPADTGERQRSSVVYRFAFVPLKTVDRNAHPPQMVEIPAKDTR